MKKLIALSVAALLLAVLFVFGDSEIEKKQYGSTMPGQTYFVGWSNVAAVSSLVYTNKEIEMWYPAKISLWYTDGIAATSTLDLVTTISTDHYPDDTVTTNDSGTVVTNHWHGNITNTTYTYITNRICTLTNAANTIAQYPIDVNTELKLKNVYIQKGDILRWTFGQTSSLFYGFVGIR